MAATPTAESLALLSRFMTPDGHVVTLRTAMFDLSEPWFCWFMLRTRSQDLSPRGAVGQRGFMVGPPTAVDTAVQGVLNGKVRDRFSFAGGEIVIADPADRTMETLGAWVGPWHVMYGWFGDALRSTAQITGFFSGLAFTDTPDGLRVRSRSEKFDRVWVTKQIPGVGQLRIMDGAVGANLLPAWAGARTAAGEFWKDGPHEHPDGDPDTSYLFGSDSAVALLQPDVGFLMFDAAAAARVNSDQRAVDFLSDIQELTWSRRPGN